MDEPDYFIDPTMYMDNVNRWGYPVHLNKACLLTINITGQYRLSN